MFTGPNIGLSRKRRDLPLEVWKTLFEEKKMLVTSISSSRTMFSIFLWTPFVILIKFLSLCATAPNLDQSSILLFDKELRVRPKLVEWFVLNKDFILKLSLIKCTYGLSSCKVCQTLSAFDLFLVLQSLMKLRFKPINSMIRYCQCISRFEAFRTIEKQKPILTTTATTTTTTLSLKKMCF